MSCNVFANSNEIACKAGMGLVIAQFPDVCLTPPSPPAGPIPVPYPDTSTSKDTQQGSKKVVIKGKEVMLKNKSYYQPKVLGDEAATKGLGAGVITHTITGKTYFQMWSMDVQFEGMNVDRHLDLTTSNHMSQTGDTPPVGPNMGTPAPPSPEEQKKKECGEARASIQKQDKKLGKELRKYDPAEDAKGGHKHAHGTTVPCGHYKEIRDLQRGLRRRIKKFDEECRDTGVKIDRQTRANATREVEIPPGCSHIPITL